MWIYLQIINEIRMNYTNILDQNIYDPGFKDQFLVIGSCLTKIHPEIVKQFAKEWGSVYTFCLEQFHYNQMMAKLYSILAVANPKRVGFLTVDGSPHCIQMHFGSKYLKRGLKNSEIQYEHYVIDEQGKVAQVTMEAIDKAKRISLLGKPL